MDHKAFLASLPGGERTALTLRSDAAGLAHELSGLAADRAARAELARRGRERAAAFSWQAAARRHIEAYTLALHA